MAYCISPGRESSILCTRRASPPHTSEPRMCPPPSIRSKSYSSSPPAAEGMLSLIHILLQTIGQKYTSPQTSSILLTLESVFGTLISVVFYHEQLTVRELAGFVLIFAAVLISETKLEFLHRRPAVQQ